MQGTGKPWQPALWTTRYLTGGQIQITRGPTGAGRQGAALVLIAVGKALRAMPRAWQWGMALVSAALVQSALGEPAGLVFLVLLGLMLVPSLMFDAEQWYDRTDSPEAELAAADSLEARVAGAACRAWEETLMEPSWSSPHLATTRESFDGQREVNTIIDVGLRIHAARKGIGAQPPPGPARDYWQQQSESLDRSAMRLGERADALIRHRDQAAALSAELVQLAELERLERSALMVDDVTLETSARAVEPGVLPVSDQVAAARQAVNELVEIMVRTRAPLADQPPPSLT